MALHFLVILICLIINYVWLKDFDRFDDSWFFRIRCHIDNLSERIAGNYSYAWLLAIFLTYAIPILIVALVLLFVEQRFFGLVTMIVHIIVLLIAFDRTQPGQLASEFLRRWRAGDIEACGIYVEQELGVANAKEIGGEAELGDFFSKQLVYRCFEKMFVMFFWYMLAGPIGIVFCYVSYQLRDIQRDEKNSVRKKAEIFVINLLELVPMRLIAITFSLTGNFVRCFDNVKRTFWEFGGETSAADLLYSYAQCALSDMTQSASEEEEPALDSEPIPADRLQRANTIQALQSLLERSQAVWLILLALLTTFGLPGLG